MVVRDGCRARCCEPVVGRTSGRPRRARYTAPRKSGPSYHQWPNSSVSNGATMTPSRRCPSAALMPPSRPAKWPAWPLRPVERDRGIVRLLVAEIHVRAGHPPELEAAGPAHLVELEVRAVAGVALEAAPYLHRRPRVAHVGRHVARAAAVGDAIGLVRRPLRRGRGRGARRRRLVDLRVERRRIARQPQRPAGGGEVRVHEEEAKSGVGQVLLDAAAHPAPGRGGPWRPGAARAVGAFRQPAARRCAAEEPAMLGGADRELEPDALVARQQRQEAVRRGRADDLELPRRFEGAESGHQVAVHRLEQAPQPGEALPPVRHQRQQVRVGRLGERRRRLVTGGEALLEERLHLPDERRTGELVREHGREPDRHGGGRGLVAELSEDLQQRQVGVERRLADPIAAVRPSAVVEDVRQVAVQRQDEVHARSGHGAVVRASARR